ncbi:hypothetical protein PR048_013027 [Dryococelus australis]|uniref:PiggyBac transposable element-derived protein domain-containing protein n=1 Tax=Dryococelus australis TaxID=614101 RepID=A0ABQ9HR11_9NEOP|nr:hypothetical protein PR048_013027 [Dryococelus australis]
MDPIQYFRHLFEKDFINRIVEPSNIFSVQKNVNKPLTTDAIEMEQMYWSSQSRIEKVADVMSRNKLKEIKSNHFKDNTKQPSLTDPERGRLFKNRPLVNSLITKFRDIPFEDHMLSVDEQTVPFQGKSTLTQYNPNKPYKWGYKIFVLTDSKGLVHNFKIHTGRMNTQNPAQYKS